MAGLFTPARRRGVELLDVTADPALQCRSHRDIALSNRLFGGLRAVRAEVNAATEPGASLSLLDVGTGTGDVPRALLRVARQRGLALAAIGVDDRAELVRQAMAEHGTPGVCADALSLPFADRAFDIVVASQLLHHFATEEAISALRELNRVARRRVVVSDLRRSWVAAGGLWLVSFPLGFHRVSRHDGVVSILRGFDVTELSALVSDAVGVTPVVRRRAGWRVTASWAPA
jgi:SAM-dependent methyltransferase